MMNISLATIGVVVIVIAIALILYLLGMAKNDLKSEADERCRVADAEAEAKAIGRDQSEGALKVFEGFVNKKANAVFANSGKREKAAQQKCEEEKKLLKIAVSERENILQRNIAKEQELSDRDREKYEKSIDEIVELLDSLHYRAFRGTNYHKEEAAYEKFLRFRDICFTNQFYDLYLMLGDRYIDEMLKLSEESISDFKVMIGCTNLLNEIKQANYNPCIIFRSFEDEDSYELNTLFHRVESFIFEQCEKELYADFLDSANVALMNAIESLREYSHHVRLSGKAEADMAVLRKFLDTSGEISTILKNA